MKVDAGAHPALRRIGSRGFWLKTGVFFESDAQVLLGRSGISRGLEYHQRPLLEVWGN